MKSCVFCFAIVSALLIGCKDDETTPPTTVTPVVSLTASNLPHLDASDGHYQVWATFTIFNKANSPTHDSGFVSLGEFTIGSDGHTLIDPDSGGPAHFAIPAGQNAQLLNDVIITIQSAKIGLSRVLHDDPGPAIIGAAFVGTQALAVADLNVTYEDAFGTDFASATGKYSITAPTSVPSDSNSGVWFYEPLPSPLPSLANLGDLGAHWRYEGWVVDKADTLNIQYYSTGKFARVDSADYDGAGPGSGAGTGLNFPGQDFITGTPARPNLLDSRYAFRITIEPYPDNSEKPFFLTLLSTDVPGLAKPRSATVSSYTMQNVMALRLPAAHITVSR